MPKVFWTPSAPMGGVSLRKIVGEGTARAIVPVEEAGALLDGRDYYRAFFQAARAARRYLAIAGWQFDSDVSLLRGQDEREAGCDTRLLPFLCRLCEENPALHVYILAWDFNVIFLPEREWMQRLIFRWNTPPHIHFRFDASHTTWGSHHQKFVVVDGSVGFLGGMDICASRWDDSRHLCDHPGRVEASRQHGPYHDVQAYVRGAGVAELARLFEERWAGAGGGALKLPAPRAVDADVAVTLPLAAREVALSRTQGRTLSPPRPPVKEIRALYLRAIEAAERLVYVENQYFTSHAVYRALAARLREPDRSRLEVVIFLPYRPHAVKEQFAHGLEQTKLLRSLKEIAWAHGHRLGIYSSIATGERGKRKPVYIHSKVLIVDDRLLTIGSANTTNRSMGADSELNASFEADGWARGAPLARSIRRLRVRLLSEHTGIRDGALHPMLARARGLVPLLDRLAAARLHRIRATPLATLFDKSELLRAFKPDFMWDPERPIEEDLHELLSGGERRLFARGLRLLSELVGNTHGERVRAAGDE